VAVVRDPGGVLVAVGPVTQQRADMIARALAEGFDGLEPLGPARLLNPDEAGARLREQQRGRARREP
jgi:hypothetical protein